MSASRATSPTPPTMAWSRSCRWGSARPAAWRRSPNRRGSPATRWWRSATCLTTSRCCCGRATAWPWATHIPMWCPWPTRSPRPTVTTGWDGCWNAGGSSALSRGCDRRRQLLGQVVDHQGDESHERRAEDGHGDLGIWENPAQIDRRCNGVGRNENPVKRQVQDERHSGVDGANNRQCDAYWHRDRHIHEGFAIEEAIGHDGWGVDECIDRRYAVARQQGLLNRRRARCESGEGRGG